MTPRTRPPLDALLRRAAVLAAVYEAITVASAVVAAARGMRS